MSMNYWACWNWSIEWHTLCEMYPNETKALEQALDVAGVDIHELAYNQSMDDWDIEGDDCEEDVENITNRLFVLIEKFNIDNKPLELGLDYISSADAVGEVEEGALWYILNVEKPVPAAKKLGDKLQLKTWVTFG